jgi:hypothetical protein
VDRRPDGHHSIPQSIHRRAPDSGSQGQHGQAGKEEPGWQSGAAVRAPGSSIKSYGSLSHGSTSGQACVFQFSLLKKENNDR